MWRLLSLLALTCGCTTARTQLVLVVDSDYEPETELTGLVVRTYDEDGGAVELSLQLTKDAGTPDAGADFVRFAIPFSFGVLPRDEDFSRITRIEIDPVLRDEDEPPFTVRVLTRFLEGKTLRVPVFVARVCRDSGCQIDETCDLGACVPAFRDPTTLDPVRDGEELIPPDAATDAARR